MPTLAIAGGTSASLGRSITSALLSSKTSSSWNAVILSRTTRVPNWLRAIDPESKRTKIHAVDYLSTESLALALKGAHTVISVTSAIDGTQPQIQLNLLDAAVQAGCKRFAPAQWGFGPKGWENVESLKWTVTGVWEACEEVKDKIECAKFNQGSFMNYIGCGIYSTPEHPNEEKTEKERIVRGGYSTGEDDAVQGVQRQGDLKDGSGAFLIGMKNAIAELPQKDDGSWPRITWTSMRDIGRFVVAALDLPKWEEDLSMVGETLTMGDLLAHAEAVTGHKFQVEILKKAELEEKMGQLAEDDFMGRLWTEFKLAYIRDQDNEVVLRPVLNGLCPDVKPMGVREYMETFWHSEGQ